MPIIGTNFTKILVENKRRNLRNVKINNNLGIKSIEKMDFSLGSAKQEGVRFVFEYTSKYDEAASMLFEGEVLLLEDKKIVDDILKNWKDKKPINDDIMASIMNSALNKSTIKALELSQDMNLPAPIKLPKITKKQ